MMTTAPEQDTSEPHVCLSIPPEHNVGRGLPEWFRPTDFQTVAEFAAAVTAKLGQLPDSCLGEWAVFTTCGFGDNWLGNKERLDRIWRIALAVSATFVTAECEREEVLETSSDPRWPDHWRAALAKWQGVFELGEYASAAASVSPEKQVLALYLDYIDWERMEQDMEKDGRIVAVIRDGERHVFERF